MKHNKSYFSYASENYPSLFCSTFFTVLNFQAGTVSDGELASGKVSTSSSMLALDHMSDTSHRSSCASERPIDVGRVGSWAAGFNVLLEDPAGLHTFSVSIKLYSIFKTFF